MSKQNENQKKQPCDMHGVVARFLVIFTMTMLFVSISLLVKDLQTFQSFPIVFFTGWTFALIYKHVFN